MTVFFSKVFHFKMNVSLAFISIINCENVIHLLLFCVQNTHFNTLFTANFGFLGGLTI